MSSVMKLYSHHNHMFAERVTSTYYNSFGKEKITLRKKPVYVNCLKLEIGTCWDPKRHMFLARWYTHAPNLVSQNYYE